MMNSDMQSGAARPQVTIVLVAAMLTLAAVGTRAEEPNVDSSAQPGPEAWLVSTRGLPTSCPATLDPEQLTYRFAEGDCARWSTVAADQFFDHAATETPVVVFVHGNRTDRCDAISEGWPVFRRLRQQAAGRPFRLVIWSWPAERVGGPRRDVLLKASRSDTQSFYLAAWLDRLPPDTPVSLIGYSFGARVIGGALHLSEGGTLLGRKHETTSKEPRRPVRAMLVAAALDSEWLLPGGRHGEATERIGQLMVTRNCCDPVLRLYPRMRRNDRSSALGFAGPYAPQRLAETGLTLEVVPVESQVGRDHLWLSYLRSPAVQSRLSQYTFLQPDAP
jgi:hypothetical protein